MTLDEALRELGLDRTASSDNARRAYLRLVKTRKPEVDPAGFQRLREAFERAKEDLAWREKMASSLVVAEEEVVRSSRRGQAAAAEEAVSPADEVIAEPPAPTPTFSHAPEAAQPPFEAAPLPGPPPEAPPREPAVPTVAEIEAFVLAGKVKTAAKMLATLYDAAARRTDLSPPSVYTTFGLLLRLQESGFLKSSDLLRLSFQAWLEATGDEARLLRDHAAAIWTIIRELSALPATLSPKVRALIATAAASGNVALARPHLFEYAARNPEDGAADALLLRERAPVLAAAVGDVLRVVRHEAPPPPPSRGGFKPFLLVPFLIAVLRMCAAAGKSSSPSFDSSHLPPFTPPSFDTSRTTGRAMADARIKALLLNSEVLIGEAPPSVLDAVHAVVAALETKDCARIGEAMVALRQEIAKSTTTSELREKMAKLEDVLPKACAEEADASSDDAAPFDARARDAGNRSKKNDARPMISAPSRPVDAGKCGGLE